MFFRVEQSYITNKITGASQGHPLSALANNGEWNLSGTVGFDLRRLGHEKVSPSASDYGAAFVCSQAEPTSVDSTTSGFLPRRSKA